MAERGRRPTIGLITANIHLGVGPTLWSGVLAAAERHDVSVLCFPGDALRPGGAPRNAVYDLVGPHRGPLRLDGAICWTSTLGLPTAGERAQALTERLAGLPVISLNRPLGPHETLRMDSYSGMRKAISHLIRDHGRRRVACLRGPLASPVAVDRFRAYTDALARHRIPYDRSRVAASVDYANGAGASAMRVLVDVRGLRPGTDFDAVVACSDVLAADALRFLTERGVRVPDDVALISFNDSLEARLSDPPLTSVALPFAELGGLAVDTLLARLRGERPPAARAVSGTLVTRRSCGCPSALTAQATDGPGAAPPPLPRSAAALTAALRADARDGGVTFLHTLESHLGGWVRDVEDAAAWDRALLGLRTTVLPTLPPHARPHAERLVGQARLMIADKSYRLLEYERWAREQESRRLRALGTTLTTAVDPGAITAALDRHLPGLDVPGCTLLLPGSDATGPPATDTGTGAGSMVAAADADALYARLPRDRRFTAVLETLHIGGEHLGFALFDAGPLPAAARHGALFRALGDQISAALKGAHLFTEVRRARDAAEQASQFKTRVLGNATGELRTPVEAILRRCTDPEIRQQASTLLRLIDDLLELSRSQTDALGLSLRLLDPRPLLAEAARAPAGGHPPARLALPERLPAVRADPQRLTQLLHTLLAAAPGGDRDRDKGGGRNGGRGGGRNGGTVLAAETLPAALRVTVASPSLRVPPGEEEHLFQPFASGGPGTRLGLAVARRLAVLHGGTLTFERLGTGGVFCLDLPLPTPAGPAPPAVPPSSAPAPGRTVLVAAGGTGPPRELTALARREGLRLRVLHPDDDTASLTAGPPPAAVAWDASEASDEEWPHVTRLHSHPALRHTPFHLYGPVTGETLEDALRALRPSGLAAPAVLADGSASSRERWRRTLTDVLPGRTVRAAPDGTTACALFADDPPELLITDLTLPDMDGLDLVERLSEITGQPHLPALILSSRGFTSADAERAEQHNGVVLLGRDILTEAETARLLRAMLERARRGDPAAQRSHAPVRHALAFLEQHYRHRFSRWQVAQAAGISEDHLGRLFHREIGVTLWEYLTRLRISRAKERLARSDDSVQAIARAVGFHDRAYFSRVFRKVTGVAPHAYRDADAAAR